MSRVIAHDVPKKDESQNDESCNIGESHDTYTNTSFATHKYFMMSHVYAVVCVFVFTFVQCMCVCVFVFVFVFVFV